MADEADYLDRDCLDLIKIDNDCVECGEARGDYYIAIDLGYMVTSLGDGQYCEPCGKDELERARESLPPAKEQPQ